MSIYTTVHITVGRNINTEPMSDEKWAAFIETVRKDLTMTMTVMGVKNFSIETHTGIGTYYGITEESAKISSHFYGEMSANFAEALATILSTTAMMFEQDSIALAIGPSTLIFAGS